MFANRISHASLLSADHRGIPSGSVVPRLAEAPTLSGAGLLLATILVLIAIVDFRTHRIPDALTLPLIASGLGWTAWAGQEAFSAHLLGAFLGYVSLAGFGEIYFRRRGREGLGLGDAKLFAAGGAWLGWQSLPPALLIASVSGLIFALVTARRRGDVQLAFGPWIALGIWLVWLGAG